MTNDKNVALASLGLDIETVKKHLNIDRDFTDDDEYLDTLIGVAEASVLRHLNLESFDGFVKEAQEKHPNLDVVACIPSPIIHAELLLIGNLYANREPVSSGTVVKIPYTYEYLLSLFKNYDVK